MNEFEDNPELIGGAFATLLPLGLTKDDLGKGGTLPPSWYEHGFSLMTGGLQNTVLLII